MFKPILVTAMLLFSASSSATEFSQRLADRIDTINPMMEQTVPRHIKPGRSRPVVAVVGENSFTEVTDYIIPYAVLTEANVADVFALGTRSGTLQMFPALKIQPQASIAEFDTRFPDGADYVIVPAVHRDKDAVLIGWVQAQAAKGAIIVGVCDGVWALANAGLLENKRATGHWYSRDQLQKKFPNTHWENDKRYIVDGNIVTTTGVTASIPASLAIVEAIGGRERASAVAAALGVQDWSPGHKSAAFRLSVTGMWTAAVNWLAFWSHERIAIPVADGVDELALALTADAYSRTYRSNAYAVSASPFPIKTRRGLQLIPDYVASDAARPSDRTLAAWGKNEPPAKALDVALTDIEQIYGGRTAAWVALLVEYRRP